MLPLLLSLALLCSMLIVDDGFHLTSRLTATLMTQNKTKSQKLTNIDVHRYGFHALSTAQRFKIESNLIEQDEVIRARQTKSDRNMAEDKSQIKTAVTDTCMLETIDISVESETQVPSQRSSSPSLSSSSSSFVGKTSQLDRVGVAVTPVSISIRHAAFNDLTSIINLRLKVFYPYLMKDSAFYSKLLYKVRQRFDRGSICFIASLKNNINNNNNNNNNINRIPHVHLHHVSMTMDPSLSLEQRMNHLLPVGTVELNDFDFSGTSMEAVGSPRKLYVADLAVREDCRRMGVATALLAAVEAYATNALYEAIFLHVENHNEAGLKLYTSNGYEEYKATPHSINFTETHLQRPANLYVMLYKKLFL